MLDGLTPALKALYECIKNDALLVQVVGGLIVAFLVGLAARAYGRRNHTASSTTEYDSLTRRNRRVMIEKVRAIWVTGFLEKSLAEEARLELGLSEVPDAVEPTLDLLGRIPGQPSIRVPEGTPIMQVFDDHAGELLILGAPGAGKTTLLLELARDLLTRATADETCSIPVIFPLSTWAAQRRPFADWLVDELRQRYDVPRKVAESWVANNQILPLLDGLDEVQQDARQGCILAINQFSHDKGLLSLAICCRQADYEAIDASLQLQGAVFVHPLTREQVTSYLQSSGEQMQAFLALLHEDPTLWELLSSPLMLNLVVLAYSNQSLTALQLLETTDARQQHLFSHYIDRMFQHRGAAAPYSREQTQHWLQWLASQMQQRGQSVFYIERMQPDWLPQRQQKLVRRMVAVLVVLMAQLSYGLFFGLAYSLESDPLSTPLFAGIMGMLVGAIWGFVCVFSSFLIREKIEGLIFGGSTPVLFVLFGILCMRGEGGSYSAALSFLLNFMIVSGLIGWLSVGFAGFFLAKGRPPTEERINIAEALQWSWKEFFSSFWPKLRAGLSFGLIAGASLGGIGWLTETWRDKKIHRDFGDALTPAMLVVFGVILGAIGLFMGLISGILSGWSGSEVESKFIPNQGIRRSFWNAWVGGLASGVVVTLAGGLFFALLNSLLFSSGKKGWLVDGLSFGLFFGIAGGIMGGLQTGGAACLQHFILRLLLVRNGQAPWNYPAFLDYAADCLFLRKVGGGYAFVHRTLLEHFAALPLPNVLACPSKRHG